MTSSSAVKEIRSLIRRCEAVGARMRTCKNGGVQVRLPNTDRVVHIPSLASDRFQVGRTLKNVRTQLRNAGLDELEKDAMHEEATGRPKRAASKPALSIVEPTSASRASGIFEADIPWVTTPASEPQSCWMRVTPMLAGALLTDRHNKFNRPYVPSHGGSLETAILAGEWRQTHQGIAIDTRGIMQDGHHRCRAIADSGVAVVLQISIGMDPDNFLVLDETLARRAADLIARDGQPAAHKVAAMIKLIEAWLNDDGTLNPATRHRRKISNTAAYSIWTGERDQLIVANDVGKRVRKGAPGLNAGAVGAAYYLIGQANGFSNIYVDAFFSGLATGFHEDSRKALVHNDPRISLRTLMMNRKLNRRRTSTLDALRHVVSCWNKVVNDDRTGFAQHRDSSLPDIQVCMDRGPHGSSMPPLLMGDLDG